MADKNDGYRWVTVNRNGKYYRFPIKELVSALPKISNNMKDNLEKQKEETAKSASRILNNAKGPTRIEMGLEKDKEYNDLKYEIDKFKVEEHLSPKLTNGKFYTGKTFAQMILLIGKIFKEQEAKGQPYSRTYQANIINRILKHYKKHSPDDKNKK